MFLTQFHKIKYVCLALILMGSLFVFGGCGGVDEAIVLLPSGQSPENGTQLQMEALEAAEQEAESVSASVETQLRTVYVYVCGAVEEPGVVEVPEGSRAQEALRLAGGMKPEADPFYVNLAETVTDGQKLYFPTAEEAQTLEATAKAAEAGLVNINTASAEELCTLPGIGASRAEDILRYREKNGAFQTKEEIMKVSGIKQNAYDKLCDKITVQ